MIVLSGASASGKTEVAKELMGTYGVARVITTTTRKRRIGERNGRDYFFVKYKEFLQMINDEKFVEYTQYNDNFYGSTKDQVRDNKCVVIDPAGLKSYSAIKDKNVITFFLDCNEKIRYERMLQRGDSVEDAAKRILNDKTAFKQSNLCEVDMTINTEVLSVKEIASRIYNFYISKLNEKK